MDSEIRDLAAVALIERSETGKILPAVHLRGTERQYAIAGAVDLYDLIWVVGSLIASADRSIDRVFIVSDTYLTTGPEVTAGTVGRLEERWLAGDREGITEAVSICGVDRERHILGCSTAYTVDDRGWATEDPDGMVIYDEVSGPLTSMLASLIDRPERSIVIDAFARQVGEAVAIDHEIIRASTPLALGRAAAPGVVSVSASGTGVDARLGDLMARALVSMPAWAEFIHDWRTRP